MTDDFKDDNESAEERKKEKGGKEEGTAGGATRQGVVVSPAFYEKMGLLGASTALIAEVLQAWRHLEGQSLLQRLRSFAAGRSRASAHMEVDIDKNKDFSLIHNLFKHIKNLPNVLARKRTFDPHNAPGPK